MAETHSLWERHFMTPFLTHKTLDLHVSTCKTSKYGDESHTILGIYMWKSCDKMKKETSEVK